MKIRRVKIVFIKELIHIIRDYRSMIMAFAIPVLLLTLFGFALTLDVDNVPIVVWDQDKTQVSDDFVQKFRDSRYFRILAYCDSYPELEAYINRNDALMALVVPADYSKYFNRRDTASVQLLVDGSDSNTATIALGYVKGLVSQYNLELVINMLSSSSHNYNVTIDFRARAWFNPDLKSKNYIIPGLIAIIITVIAALLTSLTVAREWERGTMEQLISTPITSGELIFGKFLPYFMIGFIDILIAVGMAEFVFHVPLRGSLALLFVLSSLFLIGALMLGMFVSIATKQQLVASQISILATFIPAFLLSGFVYSIENMPLFIQMITFIVPARYFISILKGIYLKGIGLPYLLGDVALLSLFAFIAIFAANKKFKKRVA